ncbi:ribosome biogenesis GTP-binding protein YihA/YsxC [Hydrogenibacillus sp. N12]|uniref:ribosome biogenesis GTP-binding protein YihA/YsxC n=1 Tax=Hydrogenibacillus sp. N12 TaxID=2866627 RepID=UPI001C7CE328|nr:ribosome biogenesis GTP-binding protein YihA/YsxC [Hydrogenibacillus sp. N12]QZA33652.1 ribosome biogenesis GTP-binding protein YihA/YsxC [Hydrogenibacillus sp. N12]
MSGRAHLWRMAARLKDLPPPERPEIALVGRSNVGKSSLINALAGQNNLARTSRTPGKTRLIHLYRFDTFVLVDLPGYGYAQVSKAMRREFGRLVEGYLKTREALRLVLQLVDVRHPPTEDDRLMRQWLVFHGLKTLVVATKADKLGRGRALEQARRIAGELRLAVDEGPILFSAVTGEGKDDLWKAIHGALRVLR